MHTSAWVVCLSTLAANQAMPDTCTDCLLFPCALQPLLSAPVPGSSAGQEQQLPEELQKDLDSVLERLSSLRNLQRECAWAPLDCSAGNTACVLSCFSCWVLSGATF